MVYFHESLLESLRFSNYNFLLGFKNMLKLQFLLFLPVPTNFMSILLLQHNVFLNYNCLIPDFICKALDFCSRPKRNQAITKEREKEGEHAGGVIA